MRLPRHLFLLAAAACMPAFAQLPHIDVAGATPERIFAFTNGRDAFHCGVVNGPNSSGFHGITQRKEKLFEDHRIILGTTELDRRTATTTVTPAGLVRTYPAFNTREELCFADSLTLLIVRVTTDFRGEVLILPSWSTLYERGQAALRGGMFTLESTQRTAAWTSGLAGRWEAPDPVLLHDGSGAPVFTPIMYAGTNTDAAFTLAIEFFRPGDATPAVERSAAELGRLIDSRRERIERELAALGFWCNDERTTLVTNWIAASMSSLIMDQSGPGLYAGLPWFDDYWGRDTFISMEGGLLATGRWEKAREILLTFASFQNSDATSPEYGRVPNRVTPGEMIYNTVDGTPWFVIMAWRYFERSGDRDFLARIMPAIVRATEGTIRHHVDASGFVTHGDAETWMDAVGPAGPWSPRGDRAIDIQALWHDQLECAARFAGEMDDMEHADRWRDLAARLRGNLTRFVGPDQVLVDRLTRGGDQDPTMRPNILFAIDPNRTFHFADAVTIASLRAVMTRCVHPYGVASLAQADSNFHPFHQYPQSYPKDAAYHNGTIWTWLTGPAVSTLCHAGLADTAWVLTRALQDMALTQGAVGTLPECSDAIARDPGAPPRWSGTFSQTWSNAEYLRTIIGDYMGISVPSSTVLRLAPRMPAGLTRARVISRVGAARVQVSLDLTDPRKPAAEVVHLDGRMGDEIRVDFEVPGFRMVSTPLRSGRRVALKPTVRDAMRDSAARAAAGVHFCQPEPVSQLRALRAPDHPLLDGATVTRRNPQATLLWSELDAEGDDTGPEGGYSYPLNPMFKPGIFDIRGMSISADATMLHVSIMMKALVQPGWHPEYGFQLTELALAIRTNTPGRGTTRTIGMNAKARVPESHAFDRLIVIGGGLQIQDAEGRILAAHIPVDELHPLGNAVTGMIMFSVPLSFIGTPDGSWRFSLVSGGQDDHGGAGIGEFRAVNPTPSVWFGGGNMNDGANIYDSLLSE